MQANCTRVRTAIVGVGKMGQFHLSKMAAHPNSELVGIYDQGLDRAQEVAEKFGTRAFADIAELFYEADAVVIATPTESHYPIAREALQAGVHVLIEKPIASTSQQGEELVRLAETQGLVLMVGHLERYRLQHFLQQLGLRTDCHFLYIEADRLHTQAGREANRIDVISDLMIHDLDLVLSLKSGSPVAMSAAGMAVTHPLVDIANVRLEFADGALATISSSRVSSHLQRKFRIYGSHFYATLDFFQQQATLVQRDSDGNLKSHTVQMQVDCLEKQTDSFLQCVSNRTLNPLVSGRQAVEALKWTERIQEAVLERSQKWGVSSGASASRSDTDNAPNVRDH